MLTITTKMVQRCCVPLCDTKVGDLDDKAVKVRFHRIPLIPEKFIKWRDQMTNFGKYQPEPELTINSRLCSKHFLREDYITEEEQKSGKSGNQVLANDAVPTVFKWNDESKARLSRAIPYMKKADLQTTLSELCMKSKNQGVQCSLEEEKLKEDLHRKNNVIRQLLQRLADFEKEKVGETAHEETQTTDDTLELRPSLEPDPEMPSLTQAVPNYIKTTINNTQTRDMQTQYEIQRASVITRICAKPPKKRKFHEYYKRQS